MIAVSPAPSPPDTVRTVDPVAGVLERELIHIARAMTTVRDVDKLLGVILEKSRLVTGADAGSVYIVEQQGDATLLRFKLTQNDSVSFDSREFTMPLSGRSIAGSAALGKTALNIADVYALDPASPFHFDRSFDERTGYVTRSTLSRCRSSASATRSSASFSSSTRSASRIGGF
jgi:hypothetical protein